MFSSWLLLTWRWCFMTFSTVSAASSLCSPLIDNPVLPLKSCSETENDVLNISSHLQNSPHASPSSLWPFSTILLWLLFPFLYYSDLNLHIFRTPFFVISHLRSITTNVISLHKFLREKFLRKSTQVHTLPFLSPTIHPWVYSIYALYWPVLHCNGSVVIQNHQHHSE